MNEHPTDEEMRSIRQQASHTPSRETFVPEHSGSHLLLAEGLLYCDCGNACRGTVSKQGVAYYVCEGGASGSSPHRVKRLRADDIDRVVLAEVRAEIHRVLTLQISAREGTRQHLQEIAYERAQQQHRTDKLFQQYVDGVLSAPHFEQMNAFIHGRMTFLDDLEAKLLEQAFLFGKQRDMAVEACERVKHLLRAGGDECSKSLIKTVVDRVEVGRGRRGKHLLRFHFRCLRQND